MCPNERLKRLVAFDKKAGRAVRGWIAGIDEAGRGPLAGPVVAAAVILMRNSSLTGLDDSKKVRPLLRERLFREICRHALVGVGVVGEVEIDELNIYQATRIAMKQAVLALTRTPDLLLVDGKMHLDLPLAQKTIVAGDRQSASIAAASIVAKVYRDAWMTYLDGLYPAYLFKDHKGYPTPRHLERLRVEGPSPVHRKSFAPVEMLLKLNEKGSALGVA